VLSSVLLGAVGIGLGIALGRLEAIESFRGELAAWTLIAFGLAYAAWGFTRARRGRRHSHAHVHEDGTVHTHEHGHEGAHMHVHAAEESGVRRATPWLLFTIFVFGPCEPLIPLLMVPAAAHSFGGVILVTAVFGGVTLATMSVAVLVCLAGVERIRLGALERYSHVLAGGALAVCGLAIQFLGL
jgi:ABC-type nickel/cobalt efflux system permease component RcnA